MSWFKSSMFSRTALTVVPVANNDPSNSLLLVVTSCRRNSIKVASGHIFNLVRFAVGGVDGTDQHIVGDVVEMATVLEPRSGH